MAPKKEKEKAEKGDDGVKLILDYLRQQNRPYSATDISANLHNRVTKAFAVKALKDLHDRQEIEGRVSGKQIVYHALQQPEEEASPEEIETLKKEIELLRDDIAKSKLQEREAKASLTALAAHISTAKLRASVDELIAEHAVILARLGPMRQSSAEVEVVTPDRQEAVDREWETWRKHANKRKKICREMWYKCTEVLPEGINNRDEMWESLGLEGEL